MRTEGDIVAIYGDNGTKYATYLYFCFDYIRRTWRKMNDYIRMTWRKMNKFKKHIVGDLLVACILVLGCLYCGFNGTFLFQLIGFPLALYIALQHTFLWVKIFYDLKFSEPQKIVTKGYQNAFYTPIYNARFSNYVGYYEVSFGDPRLPGKYIYFDAERFRGGDELEVTYYKRSRYIVDIKLLKPLENKKANQNPDSIKLKRSVRPRPKR
jgi:hypothetical protein